MTVDAAPLLLIGGGVLAVEVAACARRLGREVLGCLDDDPGLIGQTRPGGLKLWGTTDAIMTLDALSDEVETDLLVCVRQGVTRRLVVERMLAAGVEARRFTTLVDPAAVVDEGVELGEGTVVLAGAVCSEPAVFGAHVLVMSHATVNRDAVVEAYVTMAAGVTLGSGVHIGTEAFLGREARVSAHVRVGARSILGAGSELLSDLADGETWTWSATQPDVGAHVSQQH
jgi:sugar O-acyltransferase (sialic acid O-acetyltransferase NeuD family)